MPLPHEIRACHLSAKPPKKSGEDTPDLEESAPGTQRTHAQISPEALRHMCNMLGHSAEGTQKLKVKLGGEGTVTHKVLTTYLSKDAARLHPELLTGEGRARVGDAALMLKRMPVPAMANRAWSLTNLQRAEFAHLPPILTNSGDIAGEMNPATPAHQKALSNGIEEILKYRLPPVAMVEDVNAQLQSSLESRLKTAVDTQLHTMGEARAGKKRRRLEGLTTHPRVRTALRLLEQDLERVRTTTWWCQESVTRMAHYDLSKLVEQHMTEIKAHQTKVPAAFLRSRYPNLFPPDEGGFRIVGSDDKPETRALQDLVEHLKRSRRKVKPSKKRKLTSAGDRDKRRLPLPNKASVADNADLPEMLSPEPDIGDNEVATVSGNTEDTDHSSGSEASDW